MKYIILILTGFLIFNSSCYKHSKGDISDPVELPKTTLIINNDIKQYFSFKRGSWWIYRDNISNEIDCLYVIYNYDYFSYSHSNYKKETNTIVYIKHKPKSDIEYKTEIVADTGNVSTVKSNLFPEFTLINNGNKFQKSKSYTFDTITKYKIDSNYYFNCIKFNGLFIYDTINLVITKNIGILNYYYVDYYYGIPKPMLNYTLLKYHIAQ